jgi:hypothetical protein
MGSASVFTFLLALLCAASASSIGPEAVEIDARTHPDTRAKPKAQPKPVVNQPPSIAKPGPQVNNPAPNPKPAPLPANKLPPARTCKQIAAEEARFEQLDQEEKILNGFERRSPHRDLVRRGQPKIPKGKNRPCTADSFASNAFESFGVEKVQNVSIGMEVIHRV